MLISSKFKNEKIVLGLMTYTFPDGNKDISEIQHIIQDYMDNDHLDILLYKKEHNDNFSGIMCIEISRATQQESDESTSTIIIHRMGVVPSFQDEDIEYLMYSELRHKYPESSVITKMERSDELVRWASKYNENQERSHS